MSVSKSVRSARFLLSYQAPYLTLGLSLLVSLVAPSSYATDGCHFENQPYQDSYGRTKTRSVEICPQGMAQQDGCHWENQDYVDSYRRTKTRSIQVCSGAANSAGNPAVADADRSSASYGGTGLAVQSNQPANLGTPSSYRGTNTEASAGTNDVLGSSGPLTMERPAGITIGYGLHAATSNGLAISSAPSAPSSDSGGSSGESGVVSGGSGLVASPSQANTMDGQSSHRLHWQGNQSGQTSVTGRDTAPGEGFRSPSSDHNSRSSVSRNSESSDSGSSSNSGSGSQRSSAPNNNVTINEADPCRYSKQFEGKQIQGDCSQTYDMLEKAEIGNTIAQVGGAMTVNAAGAIGAAKAQDAGTQSAAVRAAANVQGNTALMQLSMGAASTAMGVYQIMTSREHAANQKNLEGMRSQQQQNSVGQPASGNSEAGQQIDGAMLEQRKVAKAAMNAGVKSTLIGAQGLISGMLGMANAKQAKQLADNLSNASGNNFQLQTGTINTGSDQFGKGSTAINPGTAQDPAVASADGNVQSMGDNPTIAPPINPDPTNGGPGMGPMAGGFQAGHPEKAASGGGGGIGVGSMSPAKPEAEPGAPRVADIKGGASYNAGSPGYSNSAGAGAEKGPDLGFLANLLPKPQEEMGKNGILDYGSKRNPASAGAGAPYSLLGRDVNLFQRISDRMSAKAKSGNVGG